MHYCCKRGVWDQTAGILPEDLRPDKHEDVLDDLVEAGYEEVRPEGQAQRPEQGGLLCLLCCFHNQDFRLLHSWAVFTLSGGGSPPGGVRGLLLRPGGTEVKGINTHIGQRSDDGIV